jgi:hypothetical protein
MAVKRSHSATNSTTEHTYEIAVLSPDGKTLGACESQLL